MITKRFGAMTQRCYRPHASCADAVAWAARSHRFGGTRYRPYLITSGDHTREKSRRRESRVVELDREIFAARIRKLLSRAVAFASLIRWDAFVCAAVLPPLMRRPP